MEAQKDLIRCKRQTLGSLPINQQCRKSIEKPKSTALILTIVVAVQLLSHVRLLATPCTSIVDRRQIM